jgi:hypothetical protein
LPRRAIHSESSFSEPVPDSQASQYHVTVQASQSAGGRKLASPALAQVEASPNRSQVGAHSSHQEVIGIRVLAIHIELALLVKIGRRQHHSLCQIEEGAIAPPAKGHVFHKPVANGESPRGPRC